MSWVHIVPSVTAAFLASLVEFVEALTAVLVALVLALGPALTRIPLEDVQLAVGTLLLLFGLRWLRKAILRAGGIVALHDEAALFASETALLKGYGRARDPGRDWVAIATAFKIVMLEGMEVVFIVIAVGAAGGLIVPASLGAVAAFVVVAALGFVLHRPLARIPENALKFAVGVLLAAFGTFWTGEGIGVQWPGADWSLPGLVAGFLIAALLAVRLCSARGGAPLAAE